MKEIFIVLLNFILFFQFPSIKSQGFFLNDWKEKTIVSPSYTTVAASFEAATVTVNVELANIIGKVNKYVYGHNGVCWTGKMNNDNVLMNNISNLSPNVIRWPGGNLSNEYFWDAVENNGPKDIPSNRTIGSLNAGKATANWVMTLDDYYDMLAKTNSTGIICVNYSYARYGTSLNPVAQAAHYAAEWVRYDNGRTKYWEIGNENYGNWQVGYEIDLTFNKDNQPKIISGDLYGKHCRVFIDSMKYAASQIGSDIKIGVIAMEELVTSTDVMKDWNKKMMPHIADKADFLILHSYYTQFNDNSTATTILNSASKTKGLKDYVLNDLKTYGEVDSLPVALTEWNIFAVGSKQAVSYINGIHATLLLGEFIKNRFGLASRWDLMNGWNNGNDHGLFASSDEPGVPPKTPHAPFYYMYYFQKYFGDNMIKSTVTGNSYVVCYASSFSSGQYGIVLINKSSTKQIVNFKLSDYKNVKSVYKYVLTGGTDNGVFSRKVYVNGNGPSNDGGGPDNYATLNALATSISGDTKIELLPLSVIYLLFTNDNIESAAVNNIPYDSEIKLYPNPTKGEIWIESKKIKLNQIDIYSLDNKLLFSKQLNEEYKQSLDVILQLEKGCYIAKIRSENETFLRKIIVN